MISLKYYIESLGCPRNEVDSELFAGLSEQSGYSRTDNPMEADLVVINTCGFIKEAKEESIDTILSLTTLKEQKPNCKIVVTGCLVKRYQSDLEQNIPEVDAFIQLKDFPAYAEWLSLQSFRIERKALNNLPYSYLRISDGYNNNCSYCAIPAIRGTLKSEASQDLIGEAEAIAAKGVKELIVTAMDITQYGYDLVKQDSLISLLKQLLPIKEIEWIRLLYLHPAHIKRELIEFVRDNEKICPYFDIPIQHINDSILTRMNRKTTRTEIERIIADIRSIIPEATIRTSLITGFPGETEEQHQELLKFVEETKFNRLGVFTYSREENTPAFDYDQRVHHRTTQRRKRELMELQSTISEKLLSHFIGKKIQVIVDRVDVAQEFPLEARSRYDAPEIDGLTFIKTAEAANYKPGDILTVRISETLEHDLIGEL